MTDIDLDAIRARAEAATAGPWVMAQPYAECPDTAAKWLVDCLADGDARAADVLWTVYAPDAEGIVLPCVTGDGPTSDRNAEFIAHARTDVPALIAEVERLRAENVRVLDHVEGLTICRHLRCMVIYYRGDTCPGSVHQPRADA